MTRLSTILILSFLAIGCSKQIEDFVRGHDKGPPDSGDLPSISSDQRLGHKISSGANLISGSDIKSQFNLSPTNRVVEGTQVKARFTLHQNRPQ